MRIHKNLINQNYIFGSENGNVKQLQRCLIEQKVFDVYNNTGYYGEITIKAHKFIQAIIQKEDILKNVSGKGNSVDSVVIVADKSDNCEVIGRNFIIGQMGDSVTKLQECLKSKGVYKWSNGVTGYFGEYTNSLYRDVIQNLPCKEVKSQKWEYGERSFRVSRLQECLREDGKFDYSTITGFLGPITWRGLKS